MVSATRPRYVLWAKAGGNSWHVTLKAADGSQMLRVGDQEPETTGERLELLSVVRGLEALDQPSRVTVKLESRYVARGVLYGLEEWRRQGWIWERFGDWVPVKNADLWQRLDRALEVHEVEFHRLRIDAPSRLAGPNRPAGREPRRSVRLQRGETPADRRHATWPSPSRRRAEHHAGDPPGHDETSTHRPELLGPLRRAVGLLLLGLVPARA